VADWLQGPYVYALYDSYGFEKEQIAHLFIAGFGSSMLFGTFVGALADKYGRKRMSVAYAVFYGLACITKLYNNFALLLLGRILSGIATSLLFSSFESWMVSEHQKFQFAPAWLSQTFSFATLGNGVIAIGAGLMASYVADQYGFVAPFIVALVILVLCGIVVLATWDENFGDATIDVQGGFRNAISALKNDTRVPLLGLVQSLFEGAMYTFVFMWTPALEAAVRAAQPDNEEVLPFGTIFACFMVAIMIGSGLFGALMARQIAPEVIAVFNFVVATLSLLCATVFVERPAVVFISFLLFEICCGVYFPCQGTLRGKYIPEDCRAAIMNFFRIPLNFLVVLVLVKVGSLENHHVFAAIVLWLALAAGLQVLIVMRRGESDKVVSSARGH
jgi:MFS transporter, MFS domain-containing protein family, molybdate-anion transporter